MLLLTAALLAACAEPGAEGPTPAATAALDPDQGADPAAGTAAEGLPVPGSNPGSRPLGTARAVELTPEQVPDYYMAIQQSGGQAVSIVFAIDDERDGDPTDDPAIRITPEGGRCNPAEMRSYRFPERYRAKPVYSFTDLRHGVALLDLPAHMAIAVSEELLALGIAAEPQDTQPQNVCTRKLWERIIIAQNQPDGDQATGQ